MHGPAADPCPCHLHRRPESPAPLARVTCTTGLCHLPFLPVSPAPPARTGVFDPYVASHVNLHFLFIHSSHGTKNRDADDTVTRTRERPGARDPPHAPTVYAADASWSARDRRPRRGAPCEQPSQGRRTRAPTGRGLPQREAHGPLTRGTHYTQEGANSVDGVKRSPPLPAGAGSCPRRPPALSDRETTRHSRSCTSRKQGDPGPRQGLGSQRHGDQRKARGPTAPRGRRDRPAGNARSPETRISGQGKSSFWCKCAPCTCAVGRNPF